ncbi:MAG TPA: hypothetical protein VJ506_05535, partial [Candidatus Limnocylindrales bacterium]|nr:hypothetical protein [Candidatus Limnocylindrales bacterium]
GAPRSSSDIRVGRAIASFCVVGQGDDGGTTTVVIPSAYKVTITGGSGSELKQVASTGTATSSATWSTGQLGAPYAFWACLSGTNDAGYTTFTTTSPAGREIDLEAWPEDPTWKTEVQGELKTILPKLEAIVGRELPGRGPIVLREVAGSELGNYAGFYNPETGVVVLGEDLGQGGVVAHELSHAWFNGQYFFSTWMSEGMAEWARISTIPDTCPTPGSYPGDGAPNLSNWQFAGPRATTTDIAVVHYQYEAACYVVNSLAAKAGPDNWRLVLKALLNNERAYRAPGLVLTGPNIQASWREWLDAVDELGLVPAGVTDLDYAQNLLAQYGIATDAATLGNRSRARAHYHKLVAELGDWTMPQAVLLPMSTWGFGVAESAMSQVEAILASVAAADAALPGLDAANGPVRAQFEKARSVDDLKAAAALAADQAAAAKAVAAAAARVAAPRDTVTQIGLAGTDLDGPMAAATVAAKAGDVKAAQADVDQVNALLDGASQQGTLRIALAGGVALAVLLLLAFVVVRLRRQRQRRLGLAMSTAMPPTDGASVDVATGEPAATQWTPAEPPAPEPPTPGPPPDSPPEVPPGTGP